MRPYWLKRLGKPRRARRCSSTTTTRRTQREEPTRTLVPSYSASCSQLSLAILRSSASELRSRSQRRSKAMATERYLGGMGCRRDSGRLLPALTSVNLGPVFLRVPRELRAGKSCPYAQAFQPGVISRKWLKSFAWRHSSRLALDTRRPVVYFHV